jgi:uncharacterized protein (DUF697 family)
MDIRTETPSVGRRFINYLLGTSLGALLVSVAYPFVKFLVPPQTPESTESTVVAGQTAELKRIPERSSASAPNQGL